MDPQKDATEASSGHDTPSEEERAALVSEWRKNRPDLSWRPLEGRELDRFLPLKNKISSVLVYGGLVVTVLLIVLVATAPREVREVKGIIMTVLKPDADGTPRIIVAVPGTDLKFMTYPGRGQPRLGQQVDIEVVSNPLALWKTYRLKDASE